MDPETISVELPQLQVRALVVPDSIDKEARTVDLVIATDSPVLEYDYSQGEHVLRSLEISEEAIRSERLDKGLSLLWHHDRWNMRSLLGRTIKWWVENEELYVRARVTDAHDDADLAWRMLQDGTLSDASCGFKVYRSIEISSDDECTRKRVRGNDWEPFEATLTSVGADAKGGTRSEAETALTTCVITRALEAPERDMSKKKNEKPAAAAPDSQRSEPVAAPPEGGAEEQGSQVTESQRSEQAPAPAQPTDQGNQQSQEEAGGGQDHYRHATEVVGICAEQGLGADFAQGLITRSLNPEQARAEVSNHLASQDQEQEVNNHYRVLETDLQKRSAAVENALSHRINPAHSELDEGGRHYRGMSMTEIGREFLEARGVATRGMAAMEIAERSLHTTSDLPAVLGSTARRTLRRSYDEGRRTFPRWARQITLPDFRATERVQFGGLGLQKINEKGEIKSGKLADGKVAIKLESFGEKVGYTRQMMVNDDLDALGRIPRMWGNAGARLENGIVYALITGNAKTADGKALFHNDHNNTITGTISVDSLSDGRAAMAIHPAFGTKEAMNLEPGFLLVPSALQTIAQQHVTSITPGKSGEVNPFAGNLEVISEALLDADSLLQWYLIVGKDQYDTVEYGYLEGSSGLDLRMRPGFDIDGVEFRTTHDFGATLMGHEGFTRSDGVDA